MPEVPWTPPPADAARTTVPAAGLTARVVPVLAEAAADLLARVAAGGRTLELGWGPVRVAADGVRVEAPDHRGRPTSRHWSDDLTDTLWVEAVQRRLERESGLAPGPTTHHLDLVLVRDVAGDGTVSMRRLDPLGGPASGWELEPVTVPVDRSGTTHVRAHRLLTLHPGLVAALDLPVGTVVHADPSGPREVLGPDGSVGVVGRCGTSVQVVAQDLRARRVA